VKTINLQKPWNEERFWKSIEPHQELEAVWCWVFCCWLFYWLVC